MFVFLCIPLVGDVDTCQAYTMMGDVSSYEKDGYNITFNCENGRVRLSFLTETIVRVHMAPSDKEFPKDDLHLDENGPYAVVTYDWPGVEYKISEGFDFDLEGFVYTVRAGKLVVKVRRQPFKLAFYDAEGKLLVIVDSKVSAKIKDKSGYDAAKEGWYWGTGCFYGSAEVKTLNIKVPKGSKSRVTQITK